MTSQITDVPEGVGFALEQCDDDGSAGSEVEQGAFEELDEKLLVVAHLPVDVGGFAANVWEIEYFTGRKSALALVFERNYDRIHE